ncbi:MAG: ribonuclease Z [Magnetococcales bacterium]|nr:ribonuclease Z [Magnetococcales bacterium]MBF0150136.1 ribonuclease Z [Magnetococcales bacterium]MBF0172866.1 ribonuclease Z [Magnetococcales bacterium]MBF0348093.1 ribonuclease Z [Magnetococcales bacterium]MBF0631267.1 ribonuclease Z [Magnetococcales bacterium]
MKGIVLGSGTGIPSPSRNSAGYHLEAGGLNLLIDCGPGTLRRLVRARKGITSLDAVFITHTHPDHVGDLTSLIHGLRIGATGRRKKLTVYGPPGFRDFFDRIVMTQVRLPDHFTIEALEVEETITLGSLVVRTFPVRHVESLNSVAYRFEEAGAAIVFSGDCDYDQTLIDGSRNADILILDCCTLDSDKMEGHLSAGLAGLVAAKAGVKHLIPTHFYPIPAADSEREQECRIQFSGKITLAEDLMTFEA